MIDRRGKPGETGTDETVPPSRPESFQILFYLAALLGRPSAAQPVAPLERGVFRKYWPIWAVLAVPPSTTRTRELVADEFGSADSGESESYSGEALNNASDGNHLDRKSVV